MRFARDIYNAIYSPVHKLALLDISKDEIPTDKTFETQVMLSDAALSPEVAANAELRQYTGGYDCLAALRIKTYPEFESKTAGAA